LLRACGVDAALPHGQADPGLIIASDPSAATDDFIAAIVKHRHFARETDPSRI
jgi:catalase